MPGPADKPVPPALAELTGTVLEQRYELGRVLGAGGMGAVFEAKHLRLDRRVAIKILRPMFAGHDEYIARFLREAKAASKIRHRNVVDILDYGEAADGLAYSVMEFLVGQDLEQLLRECPEGRLPWGKACGLLIQIASGLKAAHGQGVVHRDVKPANCFVTEEEGDPVVKLLDFGIAKVEEADHQLTATSQVLGTPSYIAPEQARSKQPANQRSDIYSFGVLAYRTLTGRLPFTGDTVFEVLRQTCFEPAPPPREHAPEIPPDVATFVLELMAKDPGDRPLDMLVVRDRLLDLSQRTLGVEVVAFAPSGPLPSASPKEMVAPDGAVRSLEPTPQGTTRPKPLDASVARTAPEHVQPHAPQNVDRQESTALLMTIPAAPLGPEAASASSPSRSGETVLAVDGPELSAEQADSRNRSGRGPVRPFVIGSLAVLSLGAAVLLPSLFTTGSTSPRHRRDDVSVSDPPANALLRHPTASDSTTSSSMPSLDAADETLPVAASIAEEAPPGASSGTGASSGDDGLSAETGVPERAEGDGMVDQGPLAKVDGASSTPAARPKPTRQSGKSSGRAKVPPSDSSLITTIKGNIESRCAKALNGGSVIVSFVVDTDGRVQDLTARTDQPAGKAAGSCATVQVQGIRFRPRHEDERKKISIIGRP